MENPLTKISNKTNSVFYGICIYLVVTGFVNTAASYYGETAYDENESYASDKKNKHIFLKINKIISFIIGMIGIIAIIIMMLKSNKDKNTLLKTLAAAAVKK